MSVQMDTILEAYQLLENNQAEKAIQLLKQYESKASDDEKFTIAQMYMQIGFYKKRALFYINYCKNILPKVKY